MSQKLTLVMPLRGRNLFTLRFLYHANKVRMPYRLLMADGLVNPKLAEVLENSRVWFPNLDIEYVRYPDDKDFAHFFNKLSDAVNRVTTPFTMLVDNDDFVTPTGVERALDFLEHKPNHVGCSGRILKFSVYSRGNDDGGVRGPINSLAMCFPLRDAAGPAVMSRFRDTLFYVWPYYAVTRTEAMQLVCREVATASFSDLQIYETYQVMRILSLGRVAQDGSMVTYIRQVGTSLNASYKRDWVHHMVRSRLTADIESFIGKLSLAAVAAGADPLSVRADLYELLEQKFRQLVRATYGSGQEFKQILRKRIPSFVSWYQNRRRFGAGQSLQNLLRDMARYGASSNYLETFKTEFSDIREVVSGLDFADFLKPFVAEFAEFDAKHRKASNLW